MPRFRLSPQTRKQWRRFRSIKRGYYSLLAILALLVASLFAELLGQQPRAHRQVRRRVLLPDVRRICRRRRPSASTINMRRTIGSSRPKLPSERAAAEQAGTEPRDDWVLMPLVPYNAFETDFRTDSFPPYAPSSSARHYLGTDTTGRDIVARLVYGFRLAMAFALILLICNYLVGITLGGAMGYCRPLRSTSRSSGSSRSGPTCRSCMSS